MPAPERLLEFLRPFKSHERDDALVFLVNDKAALRVVAAWSNLNIRWSDPGTTPPTIENELWSWLWIGCDVTPSMIAISTGLRMSIVREILPVLQSARLIYPDGTIHASAATVVAGDVARALERIIDGGVRGSGGAGARH